MILDISIVPIGTGSTSVSAWVADIQRRLAQEPDIRYEMGAMGTVVEGDPETLFRLARELHELPFAAGAGRVYTVIKIDDRRDRAATMASKIESVRQKLAKEALA